MKNTRRLLNKVVIGILMSAVYVSVNLYTTAAFAADTVILSVTLNSVSRGEFFLKRNEEGSLLILSKDLVHIGLKKVDVPITIIDKEQYVLLNELPGVTAILDEKLLLLALRAGADRVDLPRVVRDFSSPYGAYVPSTSTSGFFNYRLDYANGSGDNETTWSSTGQLGLRRSNLLFLTDSYFERTQSKQKMVRLMSTLSWDRPASISRWMAGDVNVSAGEPSGAILIGGIGYSSAFSMSPGMNIYPQGEFGGISTLPSEAEIYVNGVLSRREHLAAGDYRFQNLPVSTGANTVDIVIRDSFGNESHNSTRFYLTDSLLKAGLHDYSYNVGYIRKDFGSVSNHYDKPLLVARHSFGLTNALTPGFGAEAGDEFVNLMPRIVIGLARSGVLTLQGGESHDSGHGFGTAVAAGYQFQSRYINYQFRLNHNSREYRTMVNRQATDTDRLDGRTAISLGNSAFGTVSLNGSFAESYAGVVKRSLGVSYSRSLTSNVKFSATLNNSWGTASECIFFAGLTFFPMNELSTSASLQTSRGGDKEALSLQKNLPAGEGSGYQATLEREQTQGSTNLRANPFFQFNGPYGVYSADLKGQYNQQSGQNSTSHQISAAGAVLYSNGYFGLSRPVSSSFAVVQVEGLADVKVLLDNQEVARTNANGMAYIPSLRSYQSNLIAFDDTSLSADYLIKRYSARITPGLFGGECIYFPVARVQSYGGKLLEERGGPLEYLAVTLQGMGQEFSFSTLSGGEFYFENMVDTSAEDGGRSATCDTGSPYRRTVVAGKYAATVVAGGVVRHFEIQIPASDEMFVPLGAIRVPTASTLK